MKYDSLQHYRRFAAKLALFLAILLGMDFGAGYLMERLYRNQHRSLYYHSNYAFREAKADLVFFGSSRSRRHYDTMLFERELGLSAYNAGRDGSYIPYHYAVLKSMLSRSKPKLIVLDLLCDEFVKTPAMFQRLSSLLPYYRSTPAVRPLVEMRGPFEKLKLLSRTYPYNSMMLTLVAGAWESPDFAVRSKGYDPLHRDCVSPLTELNAYDHSADLDSVSVALYKSFLTEAKSQGAQVVVVVSPIYRLVRPTPTMKLAQKIAAEAGVPFLDYTQETTYLRHRNYFHDVNHLNLRGSRIFSGEVVNRLRLLEKSGSGQASSDAMAFSTSVTGN
ncbi:hypothetical protein [Tellurirhabdus rosea]|uniref:hypothetical protein n=1 Tax=Tellurirhabdus rosea TaxID=2674997 RepID=UPI002256F74F|nr:hypothetical protein [Tellurirhabdus rosea]